jgi:hypothetical protein
MLQVLAVMLAVTVPSNLPADFGANESPNLVREKADSETRNYINMRVGGSSASENARPVLCMEITPFARFSVEACGTGSGFLHRDPASEIAHFRAKYSFSQWHTPNGSIQLQAGFGFAELQVGEDAPGFQFGAPEGEGAVETAGPEASFSAQWLYPLYVGLELVADVNIGAAWFEHAPRLARPQERFAPFCEFSAGLGW